MKRIWHNRWEYGWKFIMFTGFGSRFTAYFYKRIRKERYENNNTDI